MLLIHKKRKIEEKEDSRVVKETKNPEVLKAIKKTVNIMSTTKSTTST